MNHARKKENEVGDILELLHEAKIARDARLAVEHEVRELKKREDDAYQKLQEAMTSSGYFTLSDGLITARIDTKQKPYIVDYGALEQYIVENKALDLLQKRLTESAVKLRWDDGIHIPGVGMSEEQKLTIK